MSDDPVRDCSGFLFSISNAGAEDIIVDILGLQYATPKNWQVTERLFVSTQYGAGGYPDAENDQGL